MPLTSHIDPKHGGTVVAADGIVLSIITAATPRPAVDRFIQYVEANAAQLTSLAKAAQAKRDWNRTNPGKGRDWPEFRNCEAAINKLLKAAGIKDS